MTPIELIHHLVSRTGESQKNLALAWLEAWNATAARALAIATAQPRFSNLMKDEMDGWRFFFGDPKRADVLFGVLGAGDLERRQLIEAAATKLASHADARVVVVLYDIEGKIDAILEALLRDLLTDRAMVPVAALVSPTQYGQIPMAFVERARLVQVVDDEEAMREVVKHPSALVLSSRPPRDPDTGLPVCSRWAAVAWKKNRFSIEPSDAVARFATTGLLSDLPVVVPAHRLDQLGVAPIVPAELLTGPELRRRMFALATATLDLPAGQRLGEANAYGVVATSTDEERVQAALIAAGLPPAQVTDTAGLERALARAAMRPGAPTVLVEGGRWHVLNADVPAPLRDHDRVVGHRFDARSTPLRRLVESVSSRTGIDWELDPFMHGAIAELDPTGRERAAFDHARAWLVYGGHCPIGARAPARDGLQRLAGLLAGPAPVAELRVTQIPSKGGGTMAPRLYSLADASSLERDVWAQVPGVGDVQWHRRERQLVLASLGDPKRIGDLLPDRYHSPHATRQKSPWDGAVWEGHLLVPTAAALDDDAWLDAMERRGADSPMRRLRDRHEAGAAEEQAERLRQAEAQEAGDARRMSRRPVAVSFPHRHDGRRDGDNVLRVSLKVFQLPVAPWAELDAALVMAWSAIGRAVRSERPLQVHDGRILLPVGPGLLAELTFTAAPDSGACRAAFVQEAECGWEVSQYGRSGWTFASVAENTRASRRLIVALSPLFSPVYAWEAWGGTRVGVSLPVGIHIVGGGISCAVRFTPDPYGLGHTLTAGTPSAIPPGVLAAVKAAKQGDDGPDR